MDIAPPSVDEWVNRVRVCTYSATTNCACLLFVLSSLLVFCLLEVMTIFQLLEHFKHIIYILFVIIKNASRLIHSMSSSARTKRIWTRHKPRTLRDRRTMRRRCGRKCFLGAKLSFPVCARTSCKVNRHGLRAAYSRARQMYARTHSRKYARVATQARRRLRRTQKK